MRLATVVRRLSFVSLGVSLAACSGGSGKTPTGTGGETGASGGVTGSGGSTATGGSSATGGVTGTGGASETGGVPGTGGTTPTGGTTATGGATGTGGAMSSPDAAADSSSDSSSDATTKRDAFSGTVKIMVIGSSNEIGTCWRADLWKELQDANIKNVDFVGQMSTGPDCGVPGYDKDLQAMNGMIVTGVPASTYAGWFKAHTPDIILQHFGGADILADKPVDGVMAAYALVLEQARLANPNVILLIAQHTPEGKDAIVTLNADIATFATQKNTAQSPVVAVDLYTGMLPSDFSDGVHLNLVGAQKVADRWYAALTPFLKP
ncbi:MAG TPA: hypothetical protein VHJ20_05045 [Polyangia bacterium]|nr:hypothetical protein [Polyangia bacterium]